ncbi:zf-TFIIB domain-containing protein [Pseudoxanthomonas sp. NC8]|nr:zf-TFIIB domain-containing protein [Pseudoxanthomonas sp. NC8]
MAERRGIEIDYCPACRGVWLDRGELDRLLAHVEPGRAAARHGGHRPDPQPGHRDRHGDSHAPRKPKSLLGELFDF